MNHSLYAQFFVLWFWWQIVYLCFCDVWWRTYMFTADWYLRYHCYAYIMSSLLHAFYTSFFVICFSWAWFQFYYTQTWLLTGWGPLSHRYFCSLRHLQRKCCSPWSIRWLLQWSMLLKSCRNSSNVSSLYWLWCLPYILQREYRIVRHEYWWVSAML